MMQRYRKMKEDATPVISRDDVPIIDQVAAAEVSQVENMNPDVPIPDEVIERVASIHERVEEHRANRGLKPSLHGLLLPRKETLIVTARPAPTNVRRVRFRLSNHAAT